MPQRKALVGQMFTLSSSVGLLERIAWLFRMADRGCTLFVREEKATMKNRAKISQAKGSIWLNFIAVPIFHMFIQVMLSPKHLQAFSIDYKGFNGKGAASEIERIRY